MMQDAERDRETVATLTVQLKYACECESFEPQAVKCTRGENVIAIHQDQVHLSVRSMCA